MVKHSRNREKQLWSDTDFVKKLEEIKAKRVLSGNPVKSMGELTREMLRCQAFKQVEKELTEIRETRERLKIKLDSKNIFR